jgi:hypothetical protein
MPGHACQLHHGQLVACTLLVYYHTCTWWFQVMKLIVVGTAAKAKHVEAL